MTLLGYARSGGFADDLARLRQAASGALSHSEDHEARAEVAQAVQQVLEFLFGSDTRMGYRVPALFWEGDLGRMIAAARLWASGDELITHSQAAQLLRGNATKPSLVYVQRLAKSGKLTHYIDPSEANWTKAGRVSRREVEALR